MLLLFSSGKKSVLETCHINKQSFSLRCATMLMLQTPHLSKTLFENLREPQITIIHFDISKKAKNDIKFLFSFILYHHSFILFILWLILFITLFAVYHIDNLFNSILVHFLTTMFLTIHKCKIKSSFEIFQNGDHSESKKL